MNEDELNIHLQLNESFVPLPFVPRRGDILDLTCFAKEELKKDVKHGICVYKVVGFEYSFPIKEDRKDPGYDTASYIHLHVIPAQFC
jgi:hypothetical protein